MSRETEAFPGSAVSYQNCIDFLLQDPQGHKAPGGPALKVKRHIGIEGVKEAVYLKDIPGHQHSFRRLGMDGVQGDEALFACRQLLLSMFAASAISFKKPVLGQVAGVAVLIHHNVEPVLHHPDDVEPAFQQGAGGLQVPA